MAHQDVKPLPNIKPGQRAQTMPETPPPQTPTEAPVVTPPAPEPPPPETPPRQDPQPQPVPAKANKDYPERRYGDSAPVEPPPPSRK